MGVQLLLPYYYTWTRFCCCLAFENSPTSLAANGKERILHSDKYHFGQKERITKFFTTVSEAKRHFSAQASASALCSRWNQINQLHKFSSSSQPIHMNKVHPTNWKLENPALGLHRTNWFAASFTHFFILNKSLKSPKSRFTMFIKLQTSQFVL